jgi:hypothetical protein
LRKARRQSAPSTLPVDRSDESCILGARP